LCQQYHHFQQKLMPQLHTKNSLSAVSVSCFLRFKRAEIKLSQCHHLLFLISSIASTEPVLGVNEKISYK
jgi:hypothetical protein